MLSPKQKEPTQEDLEQKEATDVQNITPVAFKQEPVPFTGTIRNNTFTSEIPTAKYNPAIETEFAQMGGHNTFKEAQEALKIDTENKRVDAVNSIIWQPIADKESIKSTVKKLLNAPLPNKTDGEAVAETIKTTHPKKVHKKLGEDIDIAVNKKFETDSVLKNLDEPEDSYTEFMTRPDKGAVEAATLVAKNNPTALAKINKEKDNYSYSDFFGTLKDESLDTLKYVNPLGGEDPKGQETKLWDTTKRLVSGDLSYSEIDSYMESNYGEDWEGRWAAFLAKEVAIDAAILGLALSPLSPVAAYLKVARTASLPARFASAVGRAVTVGTIGGAAQAGQNMLLDRQEDFFSERTAYEMGGRVVGFGAGEALGRVASAGASALGRGVSNLTGKTKREALAAAAKAQGVKPLSKTALSKITSKYRFEGSPTRAIVMYSLQDKVKNYNKFINSTTEKILARKDLQAQGMGREIRSSLSDLLGIERGALDNIEVTAMLPDITKLGAKFDNFVGNKSVWQNQNAINQGMGTRLYGMVKGQYENMSKDYELYLGDAGVTLRREDVGIAKSSGTLIGKGFKKARIAEPVVAAFQSATNYLTARNFSTKVGKGLQKMYREAVSGLNKKELKILDQVLKEGNTNHTVYAPNMLSPSVEMTPTLWKAYAQMRFALDTGYELLDKAKLNTFKGFLKDIQYNKVFNTSNGYVQVVSKKAAKDGSWQVKSFDNDTLSSITTKETTRIQPSQMKEITSIVPYRNGHIPRAYNPHKYSVLVVNSQMGKVSREALFDSSKELAEYVKLRNAKGTKNKGEIVISIMNNSETGFSGVRMGRSDLSLLDQMPDARRTALLKEFKLAGIDEKSARLVLEPLEPRAVPGGHHNPLTDLGTATSKEGKRLRIEQARELAAGGNKQKLSDIEAAIKKDLALNTMPTRDAIVDYLGTVAHSAGFDNWRTFALDDFTKRYADILVTGSPYAKPIFNDGTSIAQKKEAESYGRWLERNITQKTFFEKKMDNIIDSFTRYTGEQAAEGSIIAKSLYKIADTIPITNEVYGTLRFIAAGPKLLSLNIPQIAIQASQGVITASSAIAKNPFAASRAMVKLPMMGMIHATKQLGKDVPASFKKTDVYKAYEDLVKSGYASDLDTSDTIFGMRNNLDPSVGRKIWNSIKTTGAAPFRLGEAINRVSAFLAVREQSIAAIKQVARSGKAKNISRVSTADDYAIAEQLLGKETLQDVLGFDGRILNMADIGSAEFREAIVDKAQVLALNMSKAGQLEAMSGVGSVLFQFNQVLPKQMSLFDSSRLTMREKLAAAGGLVTFWGGAGIPLAADVLKLADLTVYNLIYDEDPSKRFVVSDHANATVEMLSRNLSDDPASQKFAEIFAKRGAIAAFSDDEINVISRVALGSFMSDMLDIQEPSEFVVSWSVFLKMIEVVEQLSGADKIDVATGALAGGAVLGKKGMLLGGAAGFLLNPISFMELLSRVKSGQSFEEAVEMQFEPTSTIGKALTKRIPLQSSAHEALREVGKVFSQAGSISRVLDANARDIIQPDFDRMNPMAPKKYLSSSLTGIPVERNDFRDLMLLTGFMPGKVVEEYNRQDVERKYNAALSEYRKEKAKEYKLLTGDNVGRSNLAYKATTTLQRFKLHMESLGFKANVPKNITESLVKTWLNIDQQMATGE